jgi:predicted amidohydrolase
VVDDSGGQAMGDRKLRAVSWDAVKAADEIYLMPAVQNGSASKTPLLYDDRLKAAPLAEKGRALKVAVYCPKLTDLPNETVELRINRMKEAVEQAAQANADVFIGPEYFFTKDSSKLANADFGANHAYTAKEFLAVKAAIIEIGARHKTMLLIPGTTLWKSDAQEVRNTGYLYQYLEQPGHEHSKNTSHDDAKYADHAGGQFTPGGTNFYDFEFQGLRARYEICADISAVGKTGDGKEVHLVSGFNFGGGMPARAHHGGVEVLSDGTGDGRIERPFDVKVKSKPDQGGMLVDTVDVHKTVEPEK